jgi:hypothetical protein
VRDTKRIVRSSHLLPPGFIAPCLPIASDKCKSGPAWVHEIKHDGYRLIARRPRAPLHALRAAPLEQKAARAQRRHSILRASRRRRRDHLRARMQASPAVLRIEDGMSAIGEGMRRQRARFDPNRKWSVHRSKLRAQIAVGTLIAERPPHRTVRAAFPHTAPTSGPNG